MKVLKKLFVSEDPEKQIYEILERGKNLLEKNFFDWAAVEFNKAMGINPELAIETVTKLFQEMQGGGNPDAIISLGINILQTDPENIELANLIGNAYRKKHDWIRSANMYQHCLRHDANNKFAVYNLAAAMAKVEVQDGMAISAINEFEKMSDFVLPDIKEEIESLIEMQQHFDKGKEFSSSLVDCTRVYLDQENIMTEYKNRFRSQIYDLNYDSLVTDTNKEIKSLISWLGWKWEDKYLSPHLNPRSVSTASNVQVRSPINSKSIGGWKNYKDMLRPAMEILTQTVKYQDLKY